MIKIVTQPKPFTPEIGDLYLGDHATIVRKFKKKEIKPYNMLNLAWFSRNQWKALGVLAQSGIFDIDQIKQMYNNASYQCPYTDQTFRALLPLCVYTNTPEVYFKSKDIWFFDQATDRDWNCRDDQHLDLESNYNSSITQCILGPGYTEMTNTNDGSTCVEQVIIDLDNGDKIGAIHHVWYNK